MAVNVSNIPLNTIYRFDINKYVMSTMLTNTRGENYPLREPTRFTEVYQIDDDGYLYRVASGTLIDNPMIYDFAHGFAIRDYDKDMVVSFKISMNLEKVGLKELYELQAAVAQNYEKRKK